jgi:hypothetical protein
MDITWSDVGDVLKKAAPIAAGILTGGTSTAITTVAGLVASALGCDPTPEAVQQAIQSDPQAPFKLAELEANHRRDMAALALQARANELAADTARLAEINATMRTESASEKWWVSGWRPFWGFVSGLAFAFTAGQVCWLGFRAVSGGNQDAMRMVPDLVSAMAMLFAIPGAILGVASWHRGKEKRLRAGEPVGPGLLASVMGGK